MTNSMTNSTSTLIISSPGSDNRLWSNLNNRVELLLQSRNSQLPSSDSTMVDGVSSRAKRMKEDSMLLIRGFDSIASSLSQLTSNLDNALQGTRDLARSSTMTEMIHTTIYSTNKSEDEHAGKSEIGVDIGEEKKGLKRKIDECCSDEQGENERKKQYQTEMQLKKVRNLAVSMTSKSVSLANELKTVKSDMSFLEERCAILEEENRRLREGFREGIRPDEDDLVRLQLEALLAEKSRLATDNANLTRENQCLKQLVEYHQFATQDLSASYEQVIGGLCLDFSSPGAEERSHNGTVEDQEDPMMPRSDDFEFHTPLRNKFVEVDEELVNH